jgi:tetratricopeptide (TPR) repeat protein
MARKLSEITRRAVWLFATTGGLLATAQATADEPTPAAGAPVMVQNPFVGRGHQSSAQAKRATPIRESGAIYRNPFAPGSAAPPIEYPMLPGPMSRWRPSSSPLEEPSAVKTAILSAAQKDGLPAPWDQLAEGELLRDRAVPRPTTIAPSAGDFAEPPNPVEFGATPLAQPAWLAADARPAPPDSPVGQASFDQPIAGRINTDSSSFVISDLGDSPEGSLAQAQHAASTAHTLDDLSAVASACQRGLAANPSVEIATSLRRLAAWAHNRRGELLTSVGRQDEAFSAFQCAISLDANCSLAIHNRAVSLAQQKQYSAALSDFNRVIELNPGLAIAYRNRAELLAARGRLDEAVADYSRAIESLSADAELYAARGYAWQRLGEFQRASADYDRALQIAPGDPATITQRGNLAAERGDYDRALADFQQAVASDPKCAEAHRSLAWLRATCSDARYRNAEQALAAATKAAELSPGDYLALEALAAAHAAAGQFDKAVPIQQQALAGAPSDFLEPLRHRLARYEARQPFHSGHNEQASRPSPGPRTR